MKDHAKFTAEVAKGINIKESNVELKLLIPLKSAQEHLIFLSSNQGEKVNVFLGDPQGSFDFGDEDPMYQKLTGRYVTTDGSGVVTKVEKPKGEDEDENQQKLFDQVSEQGDEGDGVKPAGDSSVDGSELEEPAGGKQPDEPGKEEPGLSEDVPEWMKEGSGADGGEMKFTDDGQQDPEGGASAEDDAGGEMDFTGNDSGQDPNDPEDELTDYEREIMGESEAEISKEALEEFIINQAPTFEDIPFDFPTLLKQRKEESKTWMQIAKEAGVPSSQISSKYSLYKKRVEKLMKGGGAA
ncbi:hypothetical protein J25TS5_14980 [Paenibacillus faecis]|uniref:hypothetical protein n=1 Tax=Paenibacillus faecis TaxID=862114 RepID=UPI001B163CCE|nr:hypothetical protein [Paenibacillus faecis]GIO84566.1 hypothetical protein J25TS5_14980 [Paenibacillus faecis]